MRGPSLAGVVLALALSLGGCASSTKPPPIAEMAPSVELGRSAEILVVAAKEGDTVATIAGRYLKDPAEFRRVAPLDTVSKAGSGLRPGAIVAIALRPLNPGGTLEDPAQRVPILCYHRFTDRAKSPSRMTVSRSDFEVQLRYLRDHGYTVIPLRALKDFLEGASELPPKSVVLTIDDGYRSTYEIAYPLLRKYAAPATLFVYSDFIGSGEALTWAQIAEMAGSALIDVQAHSKTHSDLTHRARGETDAAYERRLALEFGAPSDLLKTHAGARPTVFAYPYGAANSTVLAIARRSGLSLGLTVLRGGNATWSDPLMLRRDMVFGTDGIDGFVRRLTAATSPESQP